MKSVLFRADGNIKLGLGHIVRCLALADELKNNNPNLEVVFITKYDEGKKIIEEKNYEVIDTNDGFSQIRNFASEDTLLITDFLDTDKQYISEIKKIAGLKVISIDNNTKLKRIDADIVINANVFDEGEKKIIGSTRYFLGPKYMILRKEFSEACKGEKKIKDKVETILVMSGGADFAGGQLTLNSVEVLDKITDEISIHLITGPAFPFVNELNEILSKTTKHFNVFADPKNLIEIMKNADIAITAAGITLYELATLGIPSIVIPQVTPQTSHQENIASAFETRGACINLGKFPSNQLIYEKILMLVEDKGLRKRLSETAKKVVDGKGAERVVRLIKGGIL